MGFWGKLAGLGSLGAGAGLMFVPGAQVGGLGLMGLGAGISKHEFEDIPKEQSQMQLASETARYRPWTGLTPQMPERSSGIGAGLQGGVTGLSLGQGLNSAGLLSSAGGAGGLASAAGGPSLGVNTSLSDPSASMMSDVNAINPAASAMAASKGAGSIPMIPANYSGGMENNYAGMGQAPGGWSSLMRRPTFYGPTG